MKNHFQTLRSVSTRACFQALKPKYEASLSDFAFRYNLRHYNPAHAFRIGFNAVMIAGGPGVGPSLEVQYLLQAPAQLLAVTSSAAHAGDVVTAVGEHFIGTPYPLRCIAGASMHAAHVVSSAVLRCVMPWGGDTSAVSGPHRSSAAGNIKVGVTSAYSGETGQSTSSSSLVSLTWLAQAPAVGAVAPNAGLSHGGAQVAISPEKGSVGTARIRASVSCRFGTIAPITVSMLSGDEIVCTTPALAPGVVAVGIPAPRLFGIPAAEYRVVDGPSTMVGLCRFTLL